MKDAKVKKRKVSKKTKKSWRKHVDVKDVDAFLENERLEERLGVPFSEREDSQLFTVDKAADAAKNVVTPKYVARLALKNKEPRCFASLKPHTQVPDPITKRNRVRTKEERMDPILRKREAERKAKGILKLKEKEALKNRALAKAALANRPKKGEVRDDIWNIRSNLLPGTVEEWMSSDGIRHTIKHLGVQKRKIPLSLHKKPSVIPAVEVPHPGISYNPTYEDHQQLLSEVAEKELELIKQEKHLNRVTTQMFRKIPLDKREESILNEMSEGLPRKNQTANSESAKQKCDEEEEEDSFIVAASNKSVKNNKKTLVQRRKQRERKQEAKERVLVKIEKKKLSDVSRIKFLQKQIEAKERKQALLQQKRMKKRDRESVMPKTLSKIKFESLDPDFQLPEDLSGNLRNCIPSNMLLKDRFKSLQQRNIIAPAVIKLTRDKAKVKRFVKPGYKYKTSLDDKQ